MKKQIRPREIPDQIHTLPHSLSPVLKRIYLARNVTSLNLLEHELKYLLRPTLANLDIATQIIAWALKEDQHILIIGDYDTDGATSSTLAVKALKAFGGKYIDFLVPNRVEHGYGLSEAIVNQAYQEKKPDLIITVDNGIVNFKGVDLAKSLGIKVIITDHHLPAETLPNADAIVNPNLAYDTFESKNLAGVGVIFYVMSALRARLQQENWFENNNIIMPKMADYLDLVALGTVADVVKLDYNNRILVTQGIKRIRNLQCSPGILALLEIAKREAKQLTTMDLGFTLGPRINAPGRLEDITIGIQCLLSETKAQAWTFAQRLDAINKERRQEQGDMEKSAQEKIQDIMGQIHKKEALDWGLCLYGEDWHEGIVGLVASRIKEDYYRPTIAFAPSRGDEKGIIKGSARSIPKLHIRDVLAEIDSKYPDIIKKFGGHSMAAGLSLAKKDLDTFKQSFDSIIRQHLTHQDLEPIIFSDGELENTEFSIELVEWLKTIPWGQDFPEPLFHGIFFIESQKILKDKHLKLQLNNGKGRSVDAIAFNHPDLINSNKALVAYKLSINEFRNKKNIQLIIEQIEEA